MDNEPIDVNHKYIAIIFSFVVLMLCWNFVEKSLADFYSFRLNKTGITNGIVLSSRIDDAINGTNLECTYIYKVNNKDFKNHESIVVHDTVLHVFSGDSIRVRYNLKYPHRGSIDSNLNMRMFFIVALIIIVWSAWSVVSLVIMVLKYFKRK